MMCWYKKREKNGTHAAVTLLSAATAASDSRYIYVRAGKRGQ
jgi:hypothetical protein